MGVQLRKRKVTFCVGVVLVIAAVLVVPSGQGCPDQVPVVRGGGRIYFVPLGEFPSTTLAQLEAYYKANLALTIEPLPRIELEDAVIDYDRNQLIAEELIGLMKHHHPDLANNPEAVLIGLTEGDMYVRMYNWRFAFGFFTERRLGVISTARMDPWEFPKAEPLYITIVKVILWRMGIRFGGTPDPELLHTRLRKMTTRYIGFLHYRFPASNDRRSVLYRSILGVNDLDSIGEDF